MKENQNKQNSAWYQKFDKSSKPSKEKKDKAKERFASTAKGTTVIGRLSKSELEKLNPLEMTPLEALTYLFELQKKVKEGK